MVEHVLLSEAEQHHETWGCQAACGLGAGQMKLTLREDQRLER